MKRLIAMLLALVLILSMAPFAAFAQKETALETPVVESAPVEEVSEEILPEETVPVAEAAAQPLPKGRIITPEMNIQAPKDRSSGAAARNISVNVADCVVVLEEYPAYTGNYLRPDVYVVTPDGELLEKGTHYKVSFKDNLYIGIAKVIITGVGSCTGTLEAEFPIVPPAPKNLEVEEVGAHKVTLSFDKVKQADGYFVYVDGKEQFDTVDTTITVSNLKPGQTYEICVQAATVVDDYLFGSSGSNIVTVTPGYDLRDCDLRELGYCVYDAMPCKPNITLKTHIGETLVSGKDYTLTYENNTKIGTATVTATGINGITGTVTTTFDIVPGQVDSDDVVATPLGPDSMQVDFQHVPGAERYIVWAADWENGKSYVISTTETTETSCVLTGLEPGINYQVHVQGVTTVNGKDYTGKASYTVYCRLGKLISECMIMVEEPVVTMRSESYQPAVEVIDKEGNELKLNTDYTIGFIEPSKHIGESSIEVRGRGEYAGSAYITITVLPPKPSASSVWLRDATSVQINLSVFFRLYQWDPWHEIYLNGELVATTDEENYTLTNLSTGSSYALTRRTCVTIDGKTYYSEMSAATTFVPQYPMDRTTVNVETYAWNYTDDWICPAVTVTNWEDEVLTENVHYELRYENNKEIGQAMVTAVGLGDYSGEKSASFEIRPRPVENLQVTQISSNSVKVTWDGVEEADGYSVRIVDVASSGKINKCSYTFKDLEYDRQYIVKVWSSTDVGNRSYGSTETCTTFIFNEDGIKAAQSFQVTKLPDKLIYRQYDQLELDGGEATLTYSDGSTETIRLRSHLASTFDNGKLGKQTITITYLGMTATFEVEVIDKSATGIAVTQLPEKLSYLEGLGGLDLTGGQITVTYDDESTEVLDITADMVTGFDNTVVGSQTLTVTYMDQSATFQVEVLPGYLKMLGDVNGDEQVNNYDLLQILYCANQRVKLTGAAALAADINGDGVISVWDVQRMVLFLNKRIDSL